MYPLNDHKCSSYRKTAYLKLIYFYVRNLKKNSKKVFGHLKKKKQFNTYMDHHLHLFLPLTECCKSSLGYVIIMNILCT